MKLSEFDFNLPIELIAQHPPQQRGDSRLLVCKTNQDRENRQFSELVKLLNPHDVLVINDTKVLKARLQAQKASGGKIEVMLERILDERRFTAMIRASKSPKIGSDILLPNASTARVLAKHGMLYELELLSGKESLGELLEQHGTLPLPPYIEHSANAEDNERYQTVFARRLGAIAAPTAGLHFTETLLRQIQDHGVKVISLTLHVGAGTFLPVKTDNVDAHVMHSERYHISRESIDALVHAKQQGGRIVAVGTTSLRALEAWATETGIDLNFASSLKTSNSKDHAGDTQIFIRPGYSFKTADCLITNFHLPKSTLLMLVCAFAGKTAIFSAYQHAIVQGYRFFSYGDAMWLERQQHPAYQE